VAQAQHSENVDEVAAVWSHHLLNTLGAAAYALDLLEHRWPKLPEDRRARASRNIRRAISGSADLARFFLRHPDVVAEDPSPSSTEEREPGVRRVYPEMQAANA
jgi:hypothetical protein